MADCRIRYTQDAIDDLDVIFDYIALEDQDAALRMLDEIDRRISQLAGQPRMGAAIPTNDFSILRHGYRYLVVSPYLVFYRVEDDEVRIGRILHSKQDWLFLLFGLKSR
jgi:toxin ParE1/3/4